MEPPLQRSGATAVREPTSAHSRARRVGLVAAKPPAPSRKSTCRRPNSTVMPRHRVHHRLTSSFPHTSESEQRQTSKPHVPPTTYAPATNGQHPREPTATQRTCPERADTQHQAPTVKTLFDAHWLDGRKPKDIATKILGNFYGHLRNY
jgi:hypothetical protein